MPQGDKELHGLSAYKKAIRQSGIATEQINTIAALLDGEWFKGASRWLRWCINETTAPTMSKPMVEHIHEPAQGDDHKHEPAWYEPSYDAEGRAVADMVDK